MHTCFVLLTESLVGVRPPRNTTRKVPGLEAKSLAQLGNNYLDNLLPTTSTSSPTVVQAGKDMTYLQMVIILPQRDSCSGQWAANSFPTTVYPPPSSLRLQSDPRVSQCSCSSGIANNLNPLPLPICLVLVKFYLVCLFDKWFCFL